MPPSIPRSHALTDRTSGDPPPRAPRERFLPACTVSVPVPRPTGDLSLYVAGGLAARDRLVPLPEGAFVVGSSPRADLRLLDATVSGRHCELRNSGGLVTVADLGSKNGTWLQGARVSAGELRPGQSLRLGRASLVLMERIPGAPLPEGEVLPGVVGASLLMRRLARQVRVLAQSDLTVLVVGETGTGKELVARALHHLGPRAAAPFEPQNCGALPEQLVESELFGHERGAFTGAASAREGLFERAHGGSLFLDEIGELPLAQQPKLLRVLETRQVRRLGGGLERAVDVRVVAATHANLQERVRQGSFRGDLFFRLGEAVVEVPPLEARREDIPLLVAHFLAEASGTGGASHGAAGAVPLAELRARRYPGNVRELRNLVRRAVVLGWEQALATAPAVPEVAEAARCALRGASGRAGASDDGGRSGWRDPAPGRPLRAGEPPPRYPVPLAELEDHLLLEAYERAGGNRAEAARELGMAKSTYNDRLRRILLRRRP